MQLKRKVEGVSETDENVQASLRERKRQRTRIQLVGAAIELSRKRGFDRATVEQISAAVDVSPRTFARYFPTKQAAILAVIQDMAETTLAYLAEVAPEVEPLDALVEAHQKMLDDLHGGRHVMTPSLLAGALHVIGESPTLRSAALGQTPAGFLEAVADRMGASHEDRAPWLVMRVWLAILSAASREVAISVGFGECDATLTAKAMSLKIVDVRSDIAGLVPPYREAASPPGR